MWVELKDEPLDHSLRRFRVATLTTIGLELEVEYDDGSSELCAEDDVFPCNDHEHEEAPADHCALEYLSEAAVLHSTRTRLKDDEIYTYVGPVLLAINPQKVLKRLYAERAMKAARAAPTVLSGPTRRAHPFTEAELAVRELRDTGRSAAFVVSGESGAGKTETNRQLLRYLSWRAADGVAAHDDLAQRVVGCLPALEAFGNATTMMNPNSSRFGRFLELHYERGEGLPALARAEVRTFLLEKTRVTRIGPGERGYHIFYQLLAAGVGASLGLPDASPDGYAFLQSQRPPRGRRDDAADHAECLTALDAL